MHLPVSRVRASRGDICWNTGPGLSGRYHTLNADVRKSTNQTTRCTYFYRRQSDGADDRGLGRFAGLPDSGARGQAHGRRPPPGRQPSDGGAAGQGPRSEEHTSELQSLMRISYAVFGSTKNKKQNIQTV